MRPDEHRRAAGFSLLELMVALAVFSLAVLALLNLSAGSTRTAASAREQLMAGVVADNLAVEAMAVPPGLWAAPTSGTTTLGQQQWQWTRQTQPAPGGQLHRVTIQVRREGEAQVVSEAQVYRSLER